MMKQKCRANDSAVCARHGAVRGPVGFAAFGGWDAAGAAWFGYRTAWVNRLGVPFENLGPGPAFVSTTISAVLDLAAVT